MIDDYIAAVRCNPDVDPPPARRLADEMGVHLRDAAVADPAGPSAEAQQCAVGRFGLARGIAAQFAADAVERQTSRT